MKKYKVQLFKSSGKWYTNFEIELIVDPTIVLYDQIGRAISKNPNYNYCQPISRTLDSWFAIVTIDTLPIVIWFY